MQLAVSSRSALPRYQSGDIRYVVSLPDPGTEVVEDDLRREIRGIRLGNEQPPALQARMLDRAGRVAADYSRSHG